MILTGHSTYTQKFYSQSGFSFSFETDSMRDMNLLFTGPTGYTGQFKFITGKVYDTSGKFLSTYNDDTHFKFDFAFQTGRYSTWINNTLAEADRLFYTGSPTNYLTGFSYTGTSSYDVDMDVSLYGNRPGLTFSQLVTTDLLNYSGYVTITGYPAELYSIDPLNATGSVSTIGKTLSGNFVISGSTFNSGSIINTDFEFDFGRHNQDLSVYYNPGTTQTGTLNISNNGSVFLDVYPYTQYDDDFYISSVWNETTSFETYLQFLYRSGYTNAFGTGLGTGTYSGYLSGSGYLTGTSISGYVNTGYYNQFTGRVNTGFNPSVLMTGTGVLYAYATGEIIYNYYIQVTGSEWIIDQSLADHLRDVTGYIQGSVTGYATAANNGKYVFNNVVSGRYMEFSGGGYSIGNGLNRCFYDLNINPGSLYVDFTGYHSGQLDYTGIVDGFMLNYPGTGAFTGQAPSFYIYSTNTGYMTGFNYLTGDYLFTTGDYTYVGNNFYDYAAHGFRTGGYIKKSSIDSISGGVYEIGARITYDRQIPWGVTDYINVVARNSTTGISYIFEGTSL